MVVPPLRCDLGAVIDDRKKRGAWPLGQTPRTRMPTTETEKAPRERSFFRFLPYISRISSPDIKHAKFLWVGWLVSGAELGTTLRYRARKA